MKKCYYCPWHSDKCKNPNSKNYDKFSEDVEQCIPMLIDKSKKPESRYAKKNINKKLEKWLRYL